MKIKNVVLQKRDWEKYCNHILSELISRIYRVFPKRNNKKAQVSVLKFEQFMKEWTIYER